MHGLSGTNKAGRDQLQEYNRLNEEIAETMGSINVGPPLDDTELEEEFEELQQQAIEDKMRETGAVTVDRLPKVSNGESKLTTGPGHPASEQGCADSSLVKTKTPVVAEDDEEEELKRLQAEMAM